MANTKTDTVKKMFEVGAHYGYSKSKRHPTAKGFIYGVKNNVEIFDLEKTEELLEKAKGFVKELGTKKAQILFVGGKHEARDIIKESAENLGMPYVAGRWIGGTLTNFSQIRKRVERLLQLRKKRDKGELDKYTKKEQLLFDREIEKLENMFSGIIPMENLPKALFVVDADYQNIAVTEAQKMNIPVISLSSSDCDFDMVDYSIPGNDSVRGSIEFFTNEIVESYKEGQKEVPQKKDKDKSK